MSLALAGGRVAAMAGFCAALHSGPVRAAPPSLQSITEREIVRRQGLVQAAEGQLSEGRLLLDKGRPEEAAHVLMTAYESLPDAPVAAATKAKLRAAYASAACIWAKELLDEGRYAEGNKVIDGILDEDVDPKNEDALRLRKRAADPDRYPPALTAKHVTDVKDVTRLLTLAASAVDLGRYDKAVETYKDVLRIDPYNTAARRGMEKVEQLKSRYQESARDQRRAKLLGEVESQWESPIPPSEQLSSLFGGVDAATQVAKSARDKVVQKLRTLIVGHVDFNSATIDEVVEYMRVTSRNIDPEGRGVDFIVNLEPEARNKPLSLNLTNIPLEELLRYVTQAANAAYRVEATAVIIGSLTEHATTLISKSYKVPPDFIQTAAVDTAAAAGAPADPFAPKAGAAAGVPNGLQVRRMGAKEFLEGRGVSFPEGANASFSGGSSTLIVRNTADNIALVDTLVESALANGAKQVVITVKMIDVSETRLAELGFDWELGGFNIPGSNKVFGAGGGLAGQNTDAFGAAMPQGGDVNSTMMTGGLRSSGEILGKPTIESLIASSSSATKIPASNSRSPAQFALVGVYTDPMFQTAIRALSQSKGVDLVSSPTITAKSGQKSSVRVVREFPYPTEFDPPQIPQNFGNTAQNNSLTLINGLTGTVTSNGGSGAIPITPTTPTAFATKEVGIILEVEPLISADGKSVELSLTPSNIEFEGFIDYGSPITTADEGSRLDLNLFAFVSTGVTNTVHENHIYQPVFRNTHLTTAVNVYDGSTVVLGGLVSESRTDINDKVPLIGDIPLVGRFWQSKVTQSQKRAILFFVTVKVIDPGGNRINQATAAR